jgi:Uma2 family endonuclease
VTAVLEAKMASKPTEAFPWRPPFTVDLLFELPDTGLRYEVLGGSLVVSPQPTKRHNTAVERLSRLLAHILPLHVEALQNMAIRMPNGDGLVPDLLLTADDPEEDRKALMPDMVHTVVEVVSPGSTLNDRQTKLKMYAEAGIPCYWRIELRQWKEYSGPTPAIVVRRRLPDDGRWLQIIAAAGTLSDLPVVVDANGTVMHVKVDPAELVGPRRE